jgi:hypothetical protein
MPFATLGAGAKTSLGALALAVSTTYSTPTRTVSFTTGTLLPGSELVALVQQVATWVAAEAGRYVYYFETDDDPTALTALHAAVKDARERTLGDRKYARLFVPNRVLYAGGSSSLGSRFRGHLNCGHKAVYAMHLAYWASALDIPVRFVAARYAPTVSDEVLGTLEDQLWSELQPMMGWKGRK